MSSDLEHSPKARSPRLWLSLGLVLLPVAIAYLLLARLATSAPIIDDYWHIFAFALDFERTPTSAARLGLLFGTQVGPYKLIFDHALVALQLMTFGRLNFPFMIVLGNLTPLCLLALLWKHTMEQRPTGRNPLLFVLPVSLLVFSLNYAETVDWAISGLQQPAVILFSFLALHFLVKRRGGQWDFALACGVGLLACATYANGLLLWPAGLLYLALHDRRVGRLVGWCACFAASAAVYLFHYRSDGVAVHASLVDKGIFLAMFCGGALENMHHWPVPYISLAIGVAVLGVFLHAAWTRYDARDPFFFFTTVWLLLTAGVVANARIAMGLQLSLSSRYKIYCDLLLVFCYAYLLERYGSRGEVKGRRLLGWAIAGALVVNVSGDVAGAKFLATRRERAEQAMRAYRAHPESASPMFLVEDVLSPEELAQEDRARQELNEAIRMGIYRP